jgi:hypothetical protein
MKMLLTVIIFLCLLQIVICQNVKEQKVIQVGDIYQGGIVFFVEASGEHGLIAAPYDQTTEKVKWGRNGNTGALSLSDGQTNTKKILEYYNSSKSPQNVAETAAYICDTLSLNGQADWYLPAIDELSVMYYDRLRIGNFLSGDYCSSTEQDRYNAYSIHFRVSTFGRVVFFYNKHDKNYFVRCIREF